MNETIRQHVKRRALISLAVVLVGIGLLWVLIAIAPYAPRTAQVLAVFILAGIVVGSLAAAAGMRCPRCGRRYTRNDYARFAWFFLSEPEACPRCGESYDAPWRKWTKT